MRWLLLALIRLYWLAWPVRLRRTCLFQESCSHYVYRLARELGFWAALRGLRSRVSECRPGYVIGSTDDGTWCVRLVGGRIATEPEVAAHVLAPARQAVGLLEVHLNYND